MLTFDAFLYLYGTNYNFFFVIHIMINYIILKISLTN